MINVGTPFLIDCTFLDLLASRNTIFFFSLSQFHLCDTPTFFTNPSIELFPFDSNINFNLAVEANFRIVFWANELLTPLNESISHTLPVLSALEISYVYRSTWVIHLSSYFCDFYCYATISFLYESNLSGG